MLPALKDHLSLTRRLQPARKAVWAALMLAIGAWGKNSREAKQASTALRELDVLLRMLDRRVDSFKYEHLYTNPPTKRKSKEEV